MENIAEIVLRFLSEFSFKKVMSLILLIAMAFAVIIIFDRLTETLSLSRIDRSIELVDKLNKLDVSKDPDLLPIRKKLIAQLDEAVTPKPLLPNWSGFPNLKISVPELGIWPRMLATMVPWLLVTIFGLTQYVRGKDKNLAGPLLCLVIGFIFALLGLLLPDVWWISYLLYPMGHFTLFVLFIMSVIANQNAKKAKNANPAIATNPTIPSATQ